MATVKSTKKTPRKKAVKPVMSAATQLTDLERLLDAAVSKAVNEVQESFQGRIDALESRLDKAGKVAAVKIDKIAKEAVTVRSSASTPTVKVTEAKALETNVLTPEAAALLTPEEVAAFNQKEVNKMRARKQAQANNRKDLDKLGTLARTKEMQKRDPRVIRMAIDPDYDGDDYVRVECLRKVGLDVGVTSDLNEMIDVPRHAAKRLQESGAVRVAI